MGFEAPMNGIEGDEVDNITLNKMKMNLIFQFLLKWQTMKGMKN
jgi:hypothetical protein